MALKIINHATNGEPVSVSPSTLITWARDVGCDAQDVRDLLSRAGDDDEDGEDARDALATIFCECEFLLWRRA